MAVSVSGVVDTNVKGATGVSLAISNETIITLDVVLKDGTHNNSHVTLQFSPDSGTTWVLGDRSTNGFGSVTFTRATTMVRAYVLDAEGSDAHADVFITAK